MEDYCDICGELLEDCDCDNTEDEIVEIDDRFLCRNCMEQVDECTCEQVITVPDCGCDGK